MNKKSMYKDIIISLKELLRALDDVKHSIKVLDFKKLPQLLKKEAKIIEKLEKYAQTMKNEQTDNDINNMKKLANILIFPNLNNLKESEELLTIRHLYGELIRKIFIIGNLVEQHINLYRMIYGNITYVKNIRPGSVFVDRRM